MRIDLSKFNPEIKSALIAGPSGAGKTFLTASWPRPAWFGSMREQGFETLAYMPDWALFERGRRPITYGVQNWAELMKHVNGEVLALAARGEVQTLVIELSFLAEDIVDAFRPLAGKNGWQPFNDLANAMKFIDTLAKSRGLSVVYNAIDDGEGGILMPGKAVAKRQPAACNLTGYMRAETATKRVLYMEPFEKNMPRHRFFDRLPGKVINPTYAKLIGLLGGQLVADIEGNIGRPGEVVPAPPRTEPPAFTPSVGGGMRRMASLSAAPSAPDTDTDTNPDTESEPAEVGSPEPVIPSGGGRMRRL